MIKKIKKKLFGTQNYQISYSQQGEDLIVSFILKQLNISTPFYVDIGSNDPERLSNTYFFYKKGAQGICVDPNIDYVAAYKSSRERDVFIPIGLTGGSSTTMPYYRMAWSEFNTFDEAQAKEVERKYKGRNNIVSVVNQEIVNINEFLDRNVNKPIDFLNLDVEGLDLEILQNWNFQDHAPKIICVETKDFKSGEQDETIVELLLSHNYSLVAKNLINGIFVRY